MTDISKYRALGSKEKCIVAIALLIDGLDAIEYLAIDRDNNTAFLRAAKDFTEMSPELRIPFLGTLLRETIVELRKSNQDK